MDVFFPQKTVFSMDVEQNIENAVSFAGLLDKKNQTGEFFFTGSIVREHPAECRKISKKHFCGAHGFEHEDFSRFSFSEQKSLVEKTHAVFSENSVPLLGWRFPRLQFNSASMRLLAEKGIADFSLSAQKLKQWGDAIFFWNFAKCALTEQTFFFPLPFPSGLREFPFSHVDLFEKNPLSCNGRVILHCHNFEKIMNQL